MAAIKEALLGLPEECEEFCYLLEDRYGNDDIEENITDALTNLFLIINAFKLDRASILCNAQRHFLAEKK